MDTTMAAMLGGLLTLGFTADPGPGLFFAAELHGGVFSVALESRILFAGRVVVEPAGLDRKMTALAFALVPCARWSVLLGCLFVDGGFLFPERELAPANWEPGPLGTFGVGPRVALQIPVAERLAVRVFGDVRFAPVPSVVTTVDERNRWESSLVSGILGIAVVYE